MVVVGKKEGKRKDGWRGKRKFILPNESSKRRKRALLLCCAGRTAKSTQVSFSSTPAASVMVVVLRRLGWSDDDDSNDGHKDGRFSIRRIKREGKERKASASILSLSLALY